MKNPLFIGIFFLKRKKDVIDLDKSFNYAIVSSPLFAQKKPELTVFLESPKTLLTHVAARRYGSLAQVHCVGI